MLDDAPSDAVMDMIEAFEDGDLAPLAAYLRAGGNVFGQIAFMIAMAIDGEGPVKLTTHRTSKDRHAHSELRKRYYRNLKIGIWIEKRLRVDPTLKKNDAIADAQKQFGVGKDIARTAHKELLNQISGNLADFPEVDLVTLHQEFPGEWRKKPGPKRRVRTK